MIVKSSGILFLYGINLSTPAQVPWIHLVFVNLFKCGFNKSKSAITISDLYNCSVSPSKKIVYIYIYMLKIRTNSAKNNTENSKLPPDISTKLIFGTAARNSLIKLLIFDKTATLFFMFSLFI